VSRTGSGSAGGCKPQTPDPSPQGVGWQCAARVASGAQTAAACSCHPLSAPHASVFPAPDPCLTPACHAAARPTAPPPHVLGPHLRRGRVRARRTLLAISPETLSTSPCRTAAAACLPLLPAGGSAMQTPPATAGATLMPRWRPAARTAPRGRRRWRRPSSPPRATPRVCPPRWAGPAA